MIKESAMFLIEIDGKLHGYSSPQLLRIDMMDNDPKEYRIFKKCSIPHRLEYKEISFDELMEQEGVER